MIQIESTVIEKCRRNQQESLMAATPTKVLTAHIPLPLAEKVEEMATRLERSRGWIMKQALSAWVEQEEERYHLTCEALADVDEDAVIDQSEVRAWAESLGTENPLAVPRR
jgi:predicted transcriptional regulator